ncbi:MAG: Eco57I restriction-modification methylase domain-containing protein [Myxococcota bacterium]
MATTQTALQQGARRHAVTTAFAPTLRIDNLVERVEARRLACASSDRGHKAGLGQYFTPAATARLMADMSVLQRRHLRVLDAGAGVGSLTAAWVASLARRRERPQQVDLIAYEIDPSLHAALAETLSDCEAACAEMNIACQWDIHGEDFIEAMVTSLDDGVFRRARTPIDVAILNPPYKKFHAESHARMLLRRVGIETGNLYTAFLALAVEALARDGEVVAITPRSFCNGPYFKAFREHLLSHVSLARVHTFVSRSRAFKDDEVLQENVIFRAVRTAPQQPTVLLTESHAPEEAPTRAAEVAFVRVVHPGDPQRFIHLLIDESDHDLADAMAALPCTLDALGITVSTGRVVDFRAREHLRMEPSKDTVPLIYPTHLESGGIRWPKSGSKKPNAIVHCAASADLMVPAGVYVLVKRFSSKEERRRIVAAAFDPHFVSCREVGFENHLNYYHARGRPLDAPLAWGLTLFLNSTPVDQFFRQFNGHTQVNATDLRTLRYPSADALRSLGRGGLGRLPSQERIDALVAPVLDAASRKSSTLHQVEQAGLVVANPDEPGRPTNSPSFCYQIEPRALEVIRAFGARKIGSCSSRP